MLATRLIRPVFRPTTARCVPRPRPDYVAQRCQPFARPGLQLAHIRNYRYQSYRNPGYRYQRFQQTRSIFKAWAAQPSFYYQIGGLGTVAGGFYVYNLEEVPVSRRRRFNIVSPAQEVQQGEQLYQQTLQQYSTSLLPPYHPKHRMVQRVLNRLIPSSGLPDELNNWTVHVINENVQNAFVIPGGKVFVFSGILDVCQGEDGLAAVLGHEIAHNVAHHAAERMSSASVLLPIAWLASICLGIDLGIGNLIVDLGFLRPGSRRQESEADYIGLMMMAQSCFNPEAAIDFWARMEKIMKFAPPQFLSTHPSNHGRLEKIQAWLPEAERKREETGCGSIAGYANDFRQTFAKDAYGMFSR
ncbi:metalloendopeptidase [Elasticomyces elasticus]|nr:metalloendopeptidase [Elasticomyces elasticus]